MPKRFCTKSLWKKNKKSVAFGISIRVADQDYLGPSPGPLVHWSTTPHGPDRTGPVDWVTTHSPLDLQKDAYCVACGAYVRIRMLMYPPAFSLQNAA